MMKIYNIYDYRGVQLQKKYKLKCKYDTKEYSEILS